jgi:hypothetical protein
MVKKKERRWGLEPKWLLLKKVNAWWIESEEADDEREREREILLFIVRWDNGG